MSEWDDNTPQNWDLDDPALPAIVENCPTCAEFRQRLGREGMTPLGWRLFHISGHGPSR